METVKLKFLKYTLIILFFTTLFFANKENMPRAAEPTSYNYIATAGMDIDSVGDAEKRCSITYKNKDEQSNKKENKEGEEEDSVEKTGAINIKARTIEDVYEQTRATTKKSYIASRLKHILIGEDTLKNNFEYLIDELSRKKSLRFNTTLFITRGGTAEEFINAVDLDYDNLEKELEYVNTELIGIFKQAQCNLKDIMGIYYSDGQTGIIPYLEIIDLPGSDGNKKTFKPGGVGVICDGELKYYLDYTELRSYIFLNKTVKNSIMDITMDDNIAAFDVVSSKCDYKFIFDGEDERKLNKIKIDLSLNAIYLETESKKSEFTHENFLKLENKINEKVKEEIEQLIKKSKDEKRDFIGISKTLELKHPYKWHDMEGKWSDIYMNTDIEINVSSRILHTSNTK